MEAATAAIVAGSITAAVSIVGNVITNLVANRALKQATARELAIAALDFKTQQLNELYGPLDHLVKQNFALASKLREGKQDPTAWRLLDHIPAVLNDERDKAIVDEIIKIDEQIEKLIIEKGGLVRGTETPQSFELFLGHFRILRLKMAGTHNLKIKAEEYYPRELNQYVERACQELRRERDSLMEKGIQMLAAD